MKKVILLYLLLPVYGITQSGQQEKTQRQDHQTIKDSAAYYYKKLNQITKETIDSLRQSETYQETIDKLNYYRSRKNSHTSFTLHTGITHSDMNEFNKSIQSSGFSAMNSTSYKFGFGMSRKANRIMLDFCMSVGFNNKAQKADEKIKISYANLLLFDIGVDLLNSMRISIYPYAGLSAHCHVLKKVYMEIN